MANTIFMEQHFERDKNLKASGITVVICACLFLLFFFVQWTPPEKPKTEPIIEGIEVNLGNSDVGGGPTEPQGQRGENSNQDNTPQQQNGGQPSDDNTSTEKDPEGLPTPTKIPAKNPSPSPAPVKKETPAPPAPKPKATMGKGDPNAKGNNPGPGTSDKDPRTGSGPGTGPGSNGKPDGKPGGGTGGNGAVQIKGDRKMMYYPSRTSNVEPGVVTVSVVVTPGGVGTFQSFLKGKFLAAYKNEIIDYLRGVTFNKADHESTIEMTFNFKR